MSSTVRVGNSKFPGQATRLKSDVSFDLPLELQILSDLDLGDPAETASPKGSRVWAIPNCEGPCTIRGKDAGKLPKTVK